MSTDIKRYQPTSTIPWVSTNTYVRHLRFASVPDAFWGENRMAFRADWVGNLTIPAETNPAWHRPWPEWATTGNILLMANEARAMDYAIKAGKPLHPANVVRFEAVANRPLSDDLPAPAQ